MTNVITTTVPAIDTGIVAEARRKLVKAAKGTGAVIQGYADALCMAYNVSALDNGQLITPWYELVGKDKKGIKAERAAFVSDMTESGFNKGTVDVYWQRVKEASGYVPKGRVTGGTDVDSKTMAELKTMINRILKSEEEGQDCNASMFKSNLMDVFEGMGGDIGTLG
jgi:hypothetical protein